MVKAGKPKKRPHNVEGTVVPKRRQAPGTTIQSRENKLISLAYDLVEERMRKKTATSQETTHFLKLGSSKAALERVKLENENLLLQAKTDSLKSQKKVEELYADAIKAFGIYNGRSPSDDGTEED